MISSRQSLLWAGLLASATFASSGAFAQQAPLAAPVPPAAEAQVGAAQAPQHKRMAALKQKLQLTPAQEGAWSSFAAAHQPPARAAGQARPDRAELAKLTTPQRLDRMQARQAERSAMFAKRADATRSLYAALSPEQQKTFDTESLRFGRHGHGGHHHRHHDAPAAKS